MEEARKWGRPEHLWEREVFGGISKGNYNRKGRVGLPRKPRQGHSFAHSSSPLESNVWTQFEYECVDPFLQPSDSSYFPCSVSSQLPASLGPGLSSGPRICSSSFNSPFRRPACP